MSKAIPAVKPAAEPARQVRPQTEHSMAPSQSELSSPQTTASGVAFAAPRFAYNLSQVRIESAAPPVLRRKCNCGGSCSRCSASFGDQNDRDVSERTESAALTIQTKLRIGHPDDPLEREADATADRVMQTPEVLVANPPRPNADDLEEKDQPFASFMVQRASRSEAGFAGEVPASVHEVIEASGHPLDSTTRAFFEPRMGFSLDRVRVHTDSRAAESANAVHALAYTVGNHVVFGHSQFQPRSESGGRLLAHELAHVGQQMRQADAPSSQVRRQGKQKKDPDEPPNCSLTASLSFFTFTPEEGATHPGGPAYPPAVGMLLKRLLGEDYTVEFRDKVLTEWGSQELFDQGPNPGPDLPAGKKMMRVYVSPFAMQKYLDICVKLGKPAKLSPEHQRFLDLGKVASFAYHSISFPAWFDQSLFTAVMASRVRLLSQLSASYKDDPKSQQTQTNLDAIEESLLPAIGVMELIRGDGALTGHKVYLRLWPPVKGKTQSGDMAPVNRAPDTQIAANLIAYADARPRLASAALDTTEARKKLLDDFAGVLTLQSPASDKGDQKLSDVPTQFTAPPYPGTLSSYPELLSQLYGSTHAEYGFTMSLQFPDVFSAFQFHHYHFEAFRVPDDKWVNADQALKQGGRSASHWEMLKTRLARNEKYRQADLKAYANTLWDQIGAPGSAASLVNLNAMMRDFGTLIGTAIEALFDPSYTARFTFDDEGLYVVRCIASYDPGAEVAVRRPPTVAYVPLFARDPELLAESQLQTQVGEIEAAKKRLPEVIARLKVTTDPKEREALEKEKKQLEAATGGVEGLLTYQLDLMGKSSAKGDADRASHLQDILDTRAKRGFGAGAQRLPAVYVSDSGQILDLLLEVRTLTFDPDTGEGEWEVNDATTPSSTVESANGKRAEAIENALGALFRNSDYGRGKASVMIDGTLKAFDVPTVGPGKLLMEAASNTATLLTLIALAAAPFTGGASMALMVPAMIIGAVPSAYNIIHRAIDHTLHFDLALAMDVVNIVASLVGAGAETRAGMQAIRLGTATGKVLIVTGLGVMGASVLLMSEGILEELDRTKDIPEGLRGAEVMKIVGKFMFQAGIIVGGVLASRARGHSEPARNFDEWLEVLDRPTREKLEISQTATAPEKNFWQMYKDMDPLVRDLLTQCGSDCIPMDPVPSKANQDRIKKIASNISPKAQRTLKGMLHDNRATAALEAILDGIEDARDKAPRSKGSAKKNAATEQAVLTTGSGADYILANFTDTRVEALDPANPGKWKRARQLANDIAAAGKLDMEAVARVLDTVRRTAGADPEEYLMLLKKLSGIAGKVDGLDKLLGPGGLGGSHNYFKGSTWTLRFLEGAGLWDQVKSFEDPIPGALIDRVADIRLTDGTRVELKSWESWHYFADAGFARQIMADWIPTNGFRDPLVWSFEPGAGIGTKADLIAKMEAALDSQLAAGVRGYDDPFAGRRVDAIKAKLPQIVRVGPK